MPRKNRSVNIQQDKEKALESAINEIVKEFGEGAIMRLGDKKHINIDAISTGSLSLDIATGIGGLPKGRIVEIYGPESSGKTTLALHCIAECQKQGGEAAFIDAEHALDPAYASNLGVDTDSLLISQPDNGEQALEITESLVRSGAVEIIVIDSVAALVPKSEIEDSMGDSHVGLQARLMSQALRKLTGANNKSNCLIIFINQLREKIGIMFGNPETTTGGRALKYYSSMRIDVRKIETLKNADKEFIGNRTRAKIVKNKVAPPFKNAEFDIMYGKGISKSGELIDLGCDYGIIEKSGSWFAYNGERLAQGREKAKAVLENDPVLSDEIETKIRDKAFEQDEPTESDSNIKPDIAQPGEVTTKDNINVSVDKKRAKQTREAARAKLDIAIEDDDE